MLDRINGLENKNTQDLLTLDFYIELTYSYYSFYQQEADIQRTEPDIQQQVLKFVCFFIRPYYFERVSIQLGFF